MPVESAQGWPDGEDAGGEDWHHDVIWPAQTDQGVASAGTAGPAVADREAGPVTGRGRSRRPGRLVSLVAVAVLAAGAGAGLTIALTGPTGTPAAARSGPATGQAPGRVGGSAPGGMPSGQVSQMLVTGTVTAVSATSITIGGDGPAVTAAVTESTRVTGRVHAIGGIKVGDRVSAQLTQTGDRVTASAIQYPAQQGPGGIP